MSKRPGLPRQISTAGALLLAFNGVVGASIFALPGTLAVQFGNFSPLLFLLAGGAFLLVAIPYAKAVSFFDINGGPAAHGAVFGRLAGFELGWIYYVSRVAAFAANVGVLADYAGRWWAPLGQGWPKALLIVATTTALAGINVAGLRGSVRMLGGLTLLKALPLLLLALAALMLLGAPEPGPAPPLGELESAVLLAFYAFVGFECATVTAGETREARRAVPRALIGTVVATALLYLLVQLAFVGAVPESGRSADAPLIDLGEAVVGSTGALVVTFAALASLTGNLHSNLATSPRLTWALAERGDLPGWFGGVSTRFGTPANSILFMALLAAALALSGGFVWLAVVSTLARMLVYGATIAAAAKLETRSSLGWAALGSVGVLVCGWAAWQASRGAWITLALLAGAGLLLYFVTRRRA